MITESESAAAGSVLVAGKDAKKYVLVCMNVDCRVRGGGKIKERLESRLKEDGGCPNVEVRDYMCFGACHDGPNVVIYPDKVWYGGVKPEDAESIVDQHLKHGEIVTPLTGKVGQGLQDLIFQLLDSGIF